jgi:hypothetical protein
VALAAQRWRITAGQFAFSRDYIRRHRFNLIAMSMATGEVPALIDSPFPAPGSKEIQVKLTQFSLFAAFIAFAAFVFTAPPKAHADTYNIVAIVSDQARFFQAMDDSGLVVINTSLAGGCVTTCYATYSYGVLVGTSTTLPPIVDDQGTACSPAVPAGGSVLYGVCNNGRDAFTGRLTSGQVFPDVYTGTGTFLATGGAEPLYMDSYGDIVFDDAFKEEFFEAIDTSTSRVPEPGSIALLGTGALAAIGSIRRRLSV